MINDFINLTFDASSGETTDKINFPKQALKDYWEITCVSPLRFSYSIREVVDKWGEKAVQEITKKHFVTCHSDELTCPICNNPIVFSSRRELKKLLRSESPSYVGYCNSKEHHDFLEQKIMKHSSNVFSFKTEKYLGQPEWSLFDASFIDLLKMLSVYLEVGATTGNINMTEDYGRYKALRPYTRSLLPELVRKGYVFYVDERIPYPADVVESMDFLKSYYPEDREPNTLQIHHALSLSRLSIREVSQGYRTNPVKSFQSPEIINVCIEQCEHLIEEGTCSLETLNEIECMLIDARAKTMMDIVQSVGDKYRIPIKYLGGSDLMMKRLAKEIPLEVAVKLSCCAVEKCRYLISKPGVSNYVKGRYFLSAFNKLFNELKKNDDLKFTGKVDFDFKNDCGLATALTLVFNLDCDLNDLSVEQVMKRIYLKMKSRAEH